jgi:hypothetical protein
MTCVWYDLPVYLHVLRHDPGRIMRLNGVGGTAVVG